MYNIRRCRMRRVSPDKSNVDIGLEFPKTKVMAAVIAEKQLDVKLNRIPVGTIIDIIAIGEFDHKVTGVEYKAYCVVAGWEKTAPGRWKALPYRDGQVIRQDPKVYV